MAKKADLYSLDGKAGSKIELPAQFDCPVREDLIKRAVISDQSYFYQPKGADPRAGAKTSAKYRGRKEDYGSIKNHGISMVPKEVLPNGRFGRTRRIPSSVKGRRAHPPKPEKLLIEKMNKKEYQKALASALSATASAEYVAARGHKIPKSLALPIIIDDSKSSALKTKDVSKMLDTIGIISDIERAKEGTKKKSGVASHRSGGKRTPRSMLFVVGEKACSLAKAARNLAGVDVVEAKELMVMDLAPGTHPGRLAAYTKSALEVISKKSD